MAAEEQVVWKADSNNIYERFIEQLDEAMSGEKELTEGDQDTRYALKLQQERLREKGTKLRYHITPRGFTSNGQNLPRKWKDKHYVSEVAYYTSMWERDIAVGNGRPFRQKSKMTIYETKTDVIGGVNVEDEIYVCPGCGAPSKIKDLLGGCQYCGSRFQMSELYPKITSHYLVKDFSFAGNEMKYYLMKFMIGTGIVILIGMLIGMASRGELSPLRIGSLIGTILISAFMGVVMGYFLASITLLFKLFFEAGKTVPMMGAIGAGKRFEAFMKRYSPEFSYEYLTGKTVALLKMIMFAKNPQELPFYVGAPLGGRFQDLVDVIFRGAMGYKGMREKDGYLHVTVDVFLENAYVTNGRVRAGVNEKLRVTLVKNLNVPIQYNFSIKKLECPTCHASFDATKNKTCPYCGATYRIEDADWAVESVTVM
ncbi:MAG: hypothetical protein K6F51_15150 [Acetatifactor sp.]|nr:hypothetical protein [Acetatifactor sp.]